MQELEVVGGRDGGWFWVCSGAPRWGWKWGRGVGGHVLLGLGWRASQEAFRGACVGHISSKTPWLLAPLPRAPDSTWEQVVR